jgi:hypothetical protein
MGVKRGRIKSIELPPTASKRIARVTLDDGGRVYAPTQTLEAALDRPDEETDEEFVFVERGFLGRVSWMGTVGEAMDALVDGRITSREAEQGGVPRPRVYGREVRHIRPGLIRVVSPPGADERRYSSAIASVTIDNPVQPTVRAQRAAIAWLREPFAPFEIAEDDWVWLERMIGMMSNPGPF